MIHRCFGCEYWGNRGFAANLMDTRLIRQNLEIQEVRPYSNPKEETACQKTAWFVTMGSACKDKSVSASQP